MRLIRPPTVYRPQADTWLLAAAMCGAALPPGGSVLDICTGSGVLAIHAARLGAGSVTAVDLSRAAIAATRLNGRLHGVRLELLRGDFAEAVAGRRFDVVVANPPYVPSAAEPPALGRAVAWDAGSDGRAVLDRLCLKLPTMLAADGIALLVQSALCDCDRTIALLRAGGLKTAVVARRTVPFGPVLRGRADWLEATGRIAPGQRTEELVVVRADRITRQRG
ncbi:MULTISPECIES: HemK2/MTQ2 family protein methyltransferase [unclassified Nocardia]|uniref:HemK2/MTQ2 family protein methyltransferase n=1 Tax=unclassified Nocardia TaxID=2637762 RepID=UPI001CE41598|nr:MULTISPECIES: HemK2/MTQ2 family protein methyltransferase [unclassified Nocardia]